MKKIIHKLARTGGAMFWGWVAFLSFCLILLLCFSGVKSFEGIFSFLLYVGVVSILVVGAAWLVVTFPVDCLIPAEHVLRTPVVAALMGMVSGALVFPVYALWNLAGDWDKWLTKMTRFFGSGESWFFVGGASVVGLTAGLYLALKFPRLPRVPQ